ncbi:hypothetical protein [Nonomuraea angiospora]
MSDSAIRTRTAQRTASYRRDRLAALTRFTSPVLLLAGDEASRHGRAGLEAARTSATRPREVERATLDPGEQE